MRRLYRRVVLWGRLLKANHKLGVLGAWRVARALTVPRDWRQLSDTMPEDEQPP